MHEGDIFWAEQARLAYNLKKHIKKISICNKILILLETSFRTTTWRILFHPEINPQIYS
jgi:hypothetical protein